jgi:hypothetical protein
MTEKQIIADESGLGSAIIGPKRYKVLSIFFFRERTFFRLVAAFLLISAVFYPYPQIAMWIGFAFAAYSAIANDSIQTIGTFIASNEDRKWWHLWLFIGLIFVGTSYYSWHMFNGDVSFQRLTSKGFENSPTEFHFLQLVSPLMLLVITRLRMPVSTTFMLLSVFSTKGSAIMGVAQKSLSGYVVSFVTAIVVWYFLAKAISRLVKGNPHPYWRVAQWTTSGALWSVWIMQDAANIAVFLNRQLNFWEFLAFAGFIFLGLGLLFYLRGDKIQEIVKEKSSVTDVRSATIIDLVYAIILFFFKELSAIPMSTTWVFLGLLAGREIAMQLTPHANTGRTMRQTIRLLLRDAGFALIGLLISIALAAAINPAIQAEIKNFFGMGS